MNKITSINYENFYDNLECKILETYGYTNMLTAYPEYVSKHGLDALEYDAKSLDKVRLLKNETLTLDTYMICAYLRDIENEITRVLNNI